MVRRCEGATVRPRVRAATEGATLRIAIRRTVAHRTSHLSGFTLIELMIVMALIVVLASIGLAVHANSQTRAREAVLKEDLFRMRDAIDQYYADKNTYPPALDALVSEKYLRAIPVDPFTNSAETWQTTMSEPDAGNPSAQPGIFDVKSGSERVAIDGTTYANW
jgi:general secretion pathway protein G